MRTKKEFTRIGDPAIKRRLADFRDRAGAINHLGYEFCLARRWSISSPYRPITEDQVSKLRSVMRGCSITELYLCPVDCSGRDIFYTISPQGADFFSLAWYVEEHDWVVAPPDFSFAFYYGEDIYWDLAGPQNFLRAVLGDLGKIDENLGWDIGQSTIPYYARRCRRRLLMNRHVNRLAAS